MLGIVGSDHESFAAGRLVCGACSAPLEGVHVSVGPPTATLVTEGDGHP